MWCLWVLVVGFLLMCAFMGWACCAAAGMADDYAEELWQRMLAEALLAKVERDEVTQDAQELEDEQAYQRTVGEGLGLLG